MGYKIFQGSSRIQPKNCRIGCSANPSTLTPSRVRMAYASTRSWIRSNSSQAGRLYSMLTWLNSTLPQLLIVLKMLTQTKITRLDWDCFYGNNQIGILKWNKQDQMKLVGRVANHTWTHLNPGPFNSCVGNVNSDQNNKIGFGWG